MVVAVLSVVCATPAAASNGGTTSQDLKTGFLVGSTPKYQQIAILVGALTSALALGPILLAMNQSGTVYVDDVQFVLDSTPGSLAARNDRGEHH